MPLEFSDTTANDALTAIANDFPAGSIVEIYSLPKPAITAAPTGTQLAADVSPASPWVSPVVSRALTKQNTWSVAAVGNGIAGWFRIRDASGTDADAADNTHRRIQGLAAGPVPGTGTVSAAGGTATFSTSQAGVLNNGDIVNVAGTNYTVSAFNGTTSCTLSGAPTFGATAFTTRLGAVDMVLDNGVIAAGQTVTISSISITA